MLTRVRFLGEVEVNHVWTPRRLPGLRKPLAGLRHASTIPAEIVRLSYVVAGGGGRLRARLLLLGHAAQAVDERLSRTRRRAVILAHAIQQAEVRSELGVHRRR